VRPTAKERRIQREIDAISRELEIAMQESSDDILDTYLAFEVDAALMRLLALSQQLGRSRDARRSMGDAATKRMTGVVTGRSLSKTRKRAKTPYQKAYAAAFKKVAPRFKKKDGSWKKGGFAAAGRAARREPSVRKVKKK